MKMTIDKYPLKRCIATEIITSLIGGAISAGTALAGTAMRNNAQRRENELAFEREKEQIREQNAYNSPSAQQARMAAAGLNPNLMYQQGEQGLQSDTAHYTPAEIESGVEPLGNIGSNVISDIVGLKDMQNKTALAEADVALKQSTIDFQASASRLNNQTTERMAELLGFEKKKLNADALLSEKEVEIAEKRIHLTQAQFEKTMSDIGVNIATANKLTAEERQIAILLPSKKAYLDMSTAEKRAVIEKIAVELEIARLNKWSTWANVGINAVNASANIVNVVGTIQKLFKNGASMADSGLVNPWNNPSMSF